MIRVQSKINVVQKTTIDETSVGQRIDNYLFKQCKGVPKSHVYRILRGGEVRVNGARVRVDYRLAEGDIVRLPPMRTAAPTGDRPIPAGQAFHIVFEDEHLIVLDKPAGMAVHGGSGVSFGVIEQLRRQRPQQRMLELAHRLDRETSGLLIVAKKRAALRTLHDMMRDSAVEKHYTVLVAGCWQPALQHIRLPLLKYLTPQGERRVRVSDEGKPSHSIVRLLRAFRDCSLLDVELKSGRTHQIRVHLSHLGFPLYGDDKYGDFSLNRQLMKRGLTRMFLHAATLKLRHPATGALLDLTAPLPQALSDYLNEIGFTADRMGGDNSS